MGKHVMAKQNFCRLKFDDESMNNGILSQKSIDLDIIKDKIKRSKTKVVALNMSNVQFMDSGAVVMIVAIHKYCKRLTKQFVIEKPQKTVKDLLHIINLDRAIPIVD